jgi:alkylation response protein AidB-like acyl-CoA dehydrogenase
MSLLKRDDPSPCKHQADRTSEKKQACLFFRHVCIDGSPQQNLCGFTRIAKLRIALSTADEFFVAEVRAFLATALTPALRSASARQTGVWTAPELGRAWHRILFDKGWIAPSWPRQYGGAGFTPLQCYLLERECMAANAPVLPAMGLKMCGPVLIGHGTDAQRDFFLPRILSGEHYWCQGYSEPDSGSDLAALRCRAERDGNDYVVTGQKIWTTHAQFANWIFALVRTDGNGPPQSGISFLLIDMATPGITVRPIISISGEHEVNEVFFDAVRVPVTNRIGAENAGWTVAKYLLDFERSGGAWAARLGRMLVDIKAAAATAEMMADSGFCRRYASLCIEESTLDMLECRLVMGGRAAGTASLLKLLGSVALQAATELLVEVAGPFAAIANSGETPNNDAERGARATARYFNDRSASIYAGSSEIQRNILSRSMLRA